MVLRLMCMRKERTLSLCVIKTAILRGGPKGALEKTYRSPSVHFKAKESVVNEEKIESRSPPFNAFVLFNNCHV